MNDPKQSNGVAEERRWSLAEGFGGARFVHGPDIGKVKRLRVMPVSEHEAATAELEKERQRQKEEYEARLTLAYDQKEAQALRAEKAEEDLKEAREDRQRNFDHWREDLRVLTQLQSQLQSLQSDQTEELHAERLNERLPDREHLCDLDREIIWQVFKQLVGEVVGGEKTCERCEGHGSPITHEDSTTAWREGTCPDCKGTGRVVGGEAEAGEFEPFELDMLRAVAWYRASEASCETNPPNPGKTKRWATVARKLDGLRSIRSLTDRIKADLHSETEETTILAGPLGEAIADASGSYSLEFTTPEQVAEGFCTWLLTQQSNTTPPRPPFIAEVEEVVSARAQDLHKRLSELVQKAAPVELVEASEDDREEFSEAFQEACFLLAEIEIAKENGAGPEVEEDDKERGEMACDGGGLVSVRGEAAVGQASAVGIPESRPCSGCEQCDPRCICGHRRSLHSEQDAVCEVNGCEGCYDFAPVSTQQPHSEPVEEEGAQQTRIDADDLATAQADPAVQELVQESRDYGQALGDRDKSIPLTPAQRMKAEVAGQAAGQCQFCEGEMDGFGGVHMNNCPLVQPPASNSGGVGEQEAHWRISKADEPLTAVTMPIRGWAIQHTAERLVDFFEDEGELCRPAEAVVEAAEIVDAAKAAPSVAQEQDGVSVTYVAALTQHDPKESSTDA